MPSKGEQQEHLGGPFTDAFNGGKRLDYILVFQLFQAVEFVSGTPCFSECHDVRYFLTAQSHGAEVAGRCVQHHVRLQSSAPFGPCLKPPSDGRCCFGAQLLPNDGAAQRVKVRSCWLPGQFPMAFHFSKQDGVGVAEVRNESLMEFVHTVNMHHLCHSWTRH